MLDQALEPAAIQTQLRQALSQKLGSQLRVSAVRLLQATGTKASLEYELVTPFQSLTAIAKISTLENPAHRIQETLWQGEFGPASRDAIRVPEPLGVVPELHMTLQRKVTGARLSALIAGSGGVALARRVAEAAHKLHRAGLAMPVEHSLADELLLLEARIAQVSERYPRWEERLQSLNQACRTGARQIGGTSTGVHGDFSPHNLVLSGSELYLLDFERSSCALPALDAGYFMAHLRLQAMQALGNSRALAAQEAAFEGRYVELAGGDAGPAIRFFANLALAQLTLRQVLEHGPSRMARVLLERCEEGLGCLSPSSTLELQPQPVPGKPRPKSHPVNPLLIGGGLCVGMALAMLLFWRPVEQNLLMPTLSVAQAGALPGAGAFAEQILRFDWSEASSPSKTVKQVQERLSQYAQWPPRLESGVFDLDTQRAVFEFQLRRGIAPTGEVDQVTWRALFEGGD